MTVVAPVPVAVRIIVVIVMAIVARIVAPIVDRIRVAIGGSDRYTKVTVSLRFEARKRRAQALTEIGEDIFS